MDLEKNRSSGFKTPGQIVLIVALSIFVTEAVIMLLLHFLAISSFWGEALVDAMLLIFLVSPTLYFFLFRPMVLHIRKLREIEEELLKNEEEQFKIMIRTAMDGFWISDMRGRLLEVNDAYSRMIGYSREELLSMNISDLEVVESPEDTARHIQKISDIGEDCFETRHRCKDGSILDIEVSANYRDQDDGKFYCFLRDITGRKRYEHQLQRWQDIFRHAEWGVVVGDANFSTLGLMNPAFARMHGYTLEELTGQPIEIVFSAASRASLLDHLRRAQEFGHYSFESTNRRKNGAEFPALMDVTVVYDELREVRYCVINVQDITERKNVEIALDESGRLLRALVAENEAAREQERKSIAREVHDELGQILTALRMDVSLLRIRYGEKDDALLEKVQGMMGLVDRAIHSVRDVAANLRPAVLDMGVVPALEWLCTEFSEHSGIPCKLRPSAESFNLDESRSVVVFRIVQESLTNVARHAGASEVVVDIGQRGGDLSIQVRDNGKGFDTTLRSKKNSFGLLGLHERAIALGGDVDIISTLGQGTVVSVLIPMTQDSNDK